MKDNTKPSGGNLTWEVLFAPWILQRGRGYAEAGRVGDIQQSSYRVHAIVVGQENYDVSVTYNDANEILGMHCTCPYAEAGKFCKHSAALLYALDLDLKPLAATEAWDELDEASDFDDAYEDDIDGDGKEYVSFNLILGVVPEFDAIFNGVVKTIESFLSNIPGTRSWRKGLQADPKNGEMIIEADLLSHDTYEVIFPKMCEEIAKTYPNLPFQGVAEYCEMHGDSGEVCLVRYFQNELSVLNIASGCRLAICPECDTDILSLSELAEILIDDPEAVFVCGGCGAEFTHQELFQDDWGLVPSWMLNTYDMK